jgi:hypothetical protein
MRAYYGTEFRSILKEAATSEALLAGIPYIILTSGGPGVPDAYKRILEAEAVGRLISYFMDCDESREHILQMTRGSALGEQLEEIFAWMDKTVTRADYEDLYRSSLEAVNQSLMERIRELDVRQRESELDQTIAYDISSDDLPF